MNLLSLKKPLLLWLLVVLELPAQTQNQPASTAQPEVIKLFATVRDKHGKIVPNLTKNDFVLTQDDHPQTIQTFTQNPELPITIGLVFDTGMNQAGVLDRERSASHDFLDKVLRDNKDKAFIIHFDREVELLQDVTSSRDKLFNALGLLQTARPSQNAEDDSGAPGQRRSASGHANVLYDAIYLACNELMKTQNDRKVLVVMSDGIDRHSKETVGSAIESAQRTDTLVYTALFKDEQPASQGRGFGFPGGGGMGRRGGGTRRYPQETPVDGKKILEQISKETGGGFFEISKKQPMDQIYSTIQEDLRHQYSIAYTPEKSGDWLGFHKILLTTKQKDLVVQARQGFYPGN
ncbi:MAG TPA: VWA domain-containing protein [Terriglobales bacterium]|nr:VWA domain-containing protein [Terriglobales bacterium]